MSHMSDSQSVLSFEDVSFSFGVHRVIENASFSIEEKGFVCVIGPNGGGKTTLLKLALGLLSPEKGKILVFGGPPAALRKRIGYVPQSSRVDPLFPITVQEVVLSGRLGISSLFKPFRSNDRIAAGQALEQVGLSHCANRPFSSLSGGQQQRILIARALASEPEMLLLDEPTANLDQQVESEFLELLVAINRTLTVVLVSHDLAFVAPVARKAVCVNRRVCVHPTSHITGDVIRELYGSDVHAVRHDRLFSQAFEAEGRTGCPHS